ncbi:MAG: Uma2 family endonuclease [Dehalococcoidia bacterium]
MRVSVATYERVALEDTDHIWELVCGELVERPPMTTEHEELSAALARRLIVQLDERDYSVRANSGRRRVPSGNYRVPDVVVIPRDYVRRLQATPRTFEVYHEPMPLVVEVWSPSTGGHDVEDKLKEYQQRGDLEIWRIHPYERTLIAWRRQPDGSYTETLYTSGDVQSAFLPNVTIALESLFD